MSRRRIFNIFALCLFVFVSGCIEDNPASNREAAILKNKKEFVVGLSSSGNAWRRAFAEGVLLRAEELNNAGGIIGRKIKIINLDSNTTTATVLGQSFVDVPNMAVAITRLGLETEMPIAVMLQYNGMAMVSGSRNGLSITKLGFPLVFHGLPDTRNFAKSLADFCREKKFTNVIVVNGLSEFERGVADMFELAAGNIGVNIPERIPLNELDGWKTPTFGAAQSDESGVDAIFLAVAPDEQLKAVSTLRKAGMNQALLMTPLATNRELLEQLGNNAGQLYTLASYAETIPNNISEHFTQVFRAKYKANPLLTAADGYDTMSLLAEALKKAPSPAPSDLANSLNAIKEMEGVNGTIGFGSDRNIIVKNFYVLKNSDLKWLPVKSRGTVETD